MTEPRSLTSLRESNWRDVPTSPGVYWWYFPPDALDALGIANSCDVKALKLRCAPDGKLCLYHGMAKNLAERIQWHAAQKLTLSRLQSGFLSTFRFSLLALNGFDYSRGAERINAFFDKLSVSWQVADSREDARSIERAEIQGEYQYPLNIQGNRHAGVSEFVRHLKSSRSRYKKRFIEGLHDDQTVYLVSCVGKKQQRSSAARELYISDWFRKARRYVEASGSRWFILSAEHGLLDPDRVVPPYERTLNRMRILERREWAGRVADAFANEAPNATQVIFLAGKRYREFLAALLTGRGIKVAIPMEGLGIGEQLRWLAQQTPTPTSST